MRANRDKIHVTMFHLKNREENQSLKGASTTHNDVSSGLDTAWLVSNRAGKLDSLPNDSARECVDNNNTDR